MGFTSACDVTSLSVVGKLSGWGVGVNLGNVLCYAVSVLRWSVSFGAVVIQVNKHSRPIGLSGEWNSALIGSLNGHIATSSSQGSTCKFRAMLLHFQTQTSWSCWSCQVSKVTCFSLWVNLSWVENPWIVHSKSV